MGLKEFRLLRQILKLSTTQEDVLIGMLLGDGHLQLSRSGQLARLQIRNSQKQKDYVAWKYQFFRDWAPKGLVNDKANNSVYFDTLYHSELEFWHRKFYVKRKKIVPADVNLLFTHPISLAIWLMDDGNGYLRSKALRISSYSFAEEENQRLQGCLKDNFGLESALYEDSKGYHLYILARCAKTIVSLIQAYVHPTIMYKFTRLNPVETTRKLLHG